MFSIPVLRRRASFAVIALLALVGMFMVMSLRTTASADPGYPPTPPCSSGSSLGVACAPSHSADATTTHRSHSDGGTNVGTDSRSEHGTDGATANTGFAAITASGIALALLGGGLVLLLVGRRRRTQD